MPVSPPAATPPQETAPPPQPEAVATASSPAPEIKAPPPEQAGVEPPPSRPITQRVLLVGEWTFLSDIDRWASYGGVCGSERANKFGGLKIERRTSTGKRRVPLEFRDVTGDDATFATWIEMVEEEVRGDGDDLIFMMGQTMRAPKNGAASSGTTADAGTTAKTRGRPPAVPVTMFRRARHRPARQQGPARSAPPR